MCVRSSVVFLRCSAEQALNMRTQLDPCFSQSSDTKVVNYCDSTNQLSPKPANNMCDNPLFFVTAICVLIKPLQINHLESSIGKCDKLVEPITHSLTD